MNKGNNPNTTGRRFKIVLLKLSELLSQTKYKIHIAPIEQKSYNIVSQSQYKICSIISLSFRQLDLQNDMHHLRTDLLTQYATQFQDILTRHKTHQNTLFVTI